MSKQTPKTKKELKALVRDESINLGDIDTSNITDMSGLFHNSQRKDFSGIEKWNTSNVRNMCAMFYNCSNFNQPLSSWDVSNVRDMSNMFYNCSNFNQPLDKWNIDKVENMNSMFFKSNTTYEQAFGTKLQNKSNKGEKMSEPTNYKKGDTMSKYTPKTKAELKALVDDESIYLGDIDTSNITDMSKLFLKRDSNGNTNNPRTDFSGIEKWDVSNVKNMSFMFYGCSNFNQNISDWNVSNVEHMSYMFANCKNFNQPLDSWDISNVPDMFGMFYGAKITEKQAFGGKLKDKTTNKSDKGETMKIESNQVAQCDEQIATLINVVEQYISKNDEEKAEFAKELCKAFEIISNRLQLLSRNSSQDEEMRADLLIMSKILAKIDNQLKDTIATVKKTQLNFEEAVIKAVTANSERIGLIPNKNSLEIKLAIEKEKNRARELKLEILKLKKKK